MEDPPIFMGEPSISMGHGFNSKLLNYRRVPFGYQGFDPEPSLFKAGWKVGMGSIDLVLLQRNARIRQP